jgi:putative ABC transport system substrate-binding protein
MTNRRRFILAVGGTALWGPLTAYTQSDQKLVRIGMLGTIERERSPIIPRTLERLSELGYTEGKNVRLEYRTSDGDTAKLAAQAHELVGLKPDLIMTMGPLPPLRAVLAEKTAIPVVFAAVDYDPVDTGVVKSYNRPGGNVTGAYIAQPALAVKRFELARELFPSARRFLVMNDAFSKDQFAAVARASAQAGIAIENAEFAARPYDYGGALRQARKAGTQVVIVLMSPILFRDRAQIAKVALENKIPAIGGANAFAETGFLASYGAPFGRIAERTADIAARILRGAQPAETPVEQVNEFEFAVNMKTARSLGVGISNTILVRATRVIE